MSAKILNLKQARKTRARSEKRAAGDAAAALHGRTKAEKTAQGARRAKDAAHLDGHKRDRDE